jgi:hypothetical protein
MGVTRHYQTENWPDIEGWIIVSEDGAGNPIGIAPDGRVLSVDHDCGFETFVEGEDFVAFLQRQVANSLPEEPDCKAILQPLTEKKPWWRFWK